MIDNIDNKSSLFSAKLIGAIRSKTVWFNSILALLLSNLPTVISQVDALLPQLQPYLGADTYQRITMLLVIGNLYLRFSSKGPLETKAVSAITAAT